MKHSEILGTVYVQDQFVQRDTSSGLIGPDSMGADELHVSIKNSLKAPPRAAHRFPGGPKGPSGEEIDGACVACVTVAICLLLEPCEMHPATVVVGYIPGEVYAGLRFGGVDRQTALGMLR